MCANNYLNTKSFDKFIAKIKCAFYILENYMHKPDTFIHLRHPYIARVQTVPFSTATSSGDVYTSYAVELSLFVCVSVSVCVCVCIFRYHGLVK